MFAFLFVYVCVCVLRIRIKRDDDLFQIYISILWVAVLLFYTEDDADVGYDDDADDCVDDDLVVIADCLLLWYKFYCIAKM